MFASLRDKLQLSDGELSFLRAMICVGLFAAALAFTIVTQLGGRQIAFRAFSAYDWWSIFAGGTGGMIAFYLSRDWFGHGGGRGWLRAAQGIVIVNFLAALIGGSLALPFYGTMFGPFSLLMVLIAFPHMSMLWGVLLLLAHMALRKWRAERESIFLQAHQRLGAA